MPKAKVEFTKDDILRIIKLHVKEEMGFYPAAASLDVELIQENYFGPQYIVSVTVEISPAQDK